MFRELPRVGMRMIVGFHSGPNLTANTLRVWAVQMGTNGTTPNPAMVPTTRALRKVALNFEGTLAAPAYAISGVFNGINQGGSKDYEPVDYDSSGNEQATYPPDKILNDGGVAVSASGTTAQTYGSSCAACGFMIYNPANTYSPGNAVGSQSTRSNGVVDQGEVTYFRFALPPGYHKICPRTTGWATGLFLRTFTQDEEGWYTSLPPKASRLPR